VREADGSRWRRRLEHALEAKKNAMLPSYGHPIRSMRKAALNQFNDATAVVRAARILGVELTINGPSRQCCSHLGPGAALAIGLENAFLADTKARVG
jgi:hypothetical protein